MKNEKPFVLLLIMLLALPALLAPFGADIPSFRPDGPGEGFLTRPAEWLTQRLAGRTLLLTWRGDALRALGDGGKSTVVGRDGTLFYKEALNSAAGAKGAVGYLDGLRRRLEADGRHLIVLIAPNKATVLTDRLPGRLRARYDAGALAALETALEAAGIGTVRADSLLLQSGKAGQAYYKYDTHWNARGALIAANGLLEKLSLPPYDMETVDFDAGRAGDLLVLTAPGRDPTEQDALPALERTWRFARPMRTVNDIRIETLSGGEGPTVLLLRDSFGAGLLPYLAARVPRLIMLRGCDDPVSAAKDAGADAVVLEIAERDLTLLTTYD